MRKLITLEPCYVFGSNFEYFRFFSSSFSIFFFSFFCCCLLLLFFFFISFFFRFFVVVFFFFFFFFSFLSLLFFSSFSENVHSCTAWYVLFIVFHYFLFLFFPYFIFLTLSSHWIEKMWRRFTEHYFGRSSSFGENAHNFRTAWYI